MTASRRPGQDDRCAVWPTAKSISHPTGVPGINLRATENSATALVTGRARSFGPIASCGCGELREVSYIVPPSRIAEIVACLMASFLVGASAAQPELGSVRLPRIVRRIAVLLHGCIGR
jgi:hypothetical protein